MTKESITSFAEEVVGSAKLNSVVLIDYKKGDEEGNTNDLIHHLRGLEIMID